MKIKWILKLGLSVLLLFAFTVSVYASPSRPPNTHVLTIQVSGRGDVRVGDSGFARSHTVYLREGDRVSISARAERNYQFDRWSYSWGRAANALRRDTSFTMPNRDVTLTARFYDDRWFDRDRCWCGRWIWDERGCRYDHWHWHDRDRCWCGRWIWDARGCLYDHWHWRDRDRCWCGRWVWDDRGCRYDYWYWDDWRWRSDRHWRDVRGLQHSHGRYRTWREWDTVAGRPVLTTPHAPRPLPGTYQINDTITNTVNFAVSVPGVRNGEYQIGVSGLPENMTAPVLVNVHNELFNLHIQGLAFAPRGTYTLLAVLFDANGNPVTVPFLLTMII